MKQIIFSFDDGRKDTYYNAFTVLKKYNFTCTINIASNFIENPKSFEGNFTTANCESMTKEQVIECYENGVEIAGHGDKHTNEINDIKEGLTKLKNWGIDISEIGFASPKSYYCNKNYNVIEPLIKDKTLLYIRSGRRLKRDGVYYGVLSVFAEKLHSNRLFYLANKRNIIKGKENYKILPSVTINCNATVKQIKYLISHMKNNDSIILMYHSILKKDDIGIGKNKWYNTIEDFEEFAGWISNQKDIEVITTKEMVKRRRNV